MILFLDTTTDAYALALCTQEGRFLRRKVLMRNDRIGDAVFRTVTMFLKKKKITLIVAVLGPGRFSGIRHGIVIANTLSFAWDIPLRGIEKNDRETPRQLLNRALQQKNSSLLLVPRYGQEPTITLPKKKKVKK